MSNKEERKAPVLRFKGFTDDWEQRKLDDTITHKSGTSIEKYFSSKGLYKVISIGSYGSNGKYIDQGIRAAANEKTNSHLIKKGELSMVLNDKTGGKIIGRVLLIEKNNQYVVNQRSEIIKLSTSLWDPQFAFTYLNGPFRKKVLRIMQGGTQNYVNFSSVKKLTASLTSVREQKEIGTLFQKLDNIIILQQRKLKELQQVKQTLSQFLLNGNTHTRPTLRLNGFEDIWKENKLKDIAKISMGQSPSSNNYNKKGNGKILIQGNADIDNGGIRPRVWTTEITKLANKNDILLTVRAPVGELAITNREVVIGRGIAAIKGNKFIYNLLVQKNKEHFWDRISSGSTFKSISSNDIKQLKVYIPSEKEETLIASVLETIKNKIDFQNERINVINKLKKYLLTNLFI